MQKPIHILLVEDDPDDVHLLESALRDNHIVFQSDVIPQGDHVLPYLKMSKKFPEIIILDLNLPKMHGREVLLQLKKSDSFQNIPVLILTTSSSKADQDYCLQTGAERYLIKPVTMDGFNDIVQTILSIVVK